MQQAFEVPSSYRLKWYLIILVICLSSISTSVSPTLPIKEYSEPKGRHFSLLTWNVNYGAPGWEKAISIIKQYNADIVLLQEINHFWDSIIKTHLGSQYDNKLIKPVSRAGGYAILSKFELSEKHWFSHKDGLFPLLITEAKTRIGDVQICNVHLHPPVTKSGSFFKGYFTTSKFRLKEAKLVFSKVTNSRPLIIAGDFNEDENGASMKWLKEKKLKNALSQFDNTSETWRWKTNIYKITRRLDHILYNSHIYCNKAFVVKMGDSDHYPIYSVFSENAQTIAVTQ